MNTVAMQSFRDEIEKLAGSATPLAAVGRFLSKSPQRTALIGAGLGAVAGAATSEDDDRIGGAINGAMAGGVAGGALGGAGRAFRDTHLLSKTPLTTGQAVKGTLQRFGRGTVRFGKRQVHGFTGAFKDPLATGIRSTAMAKEDVHLMRRRLADELKHARGPAAAGKLRAAAQQDIENALSQGAHGDTALKSGLTSIPGVARGLAGKDRKKFLKTLASESTGGGGLASWGGALGVGAPLALGAYDLSRGDESEQGGLTKTQKAVNMVTGMGTGVLTGGLPIIPQMVAGSAVDRLGMRLTSPKWRSTRGQALVDSGEEAK